LPKRPPLGTKSIKLSFDSPRQLRRFEIEAKAAAALQHPNIVPVLAYGHERGAPYFAVRLIDGRNLAEIVSERRARSDHGLLPRDVAEFRRQAAEALDYAHRNEVLHRDIKPSNPLVNADQHLWIADFGLARVWRLWDLEAGSSDPSPRVFHIRANLMAMAFSPDGSTLGSVAHDGSVRLWRAQP
jgi:eukaryotic-like serine/threonine-protein kinase